MEEREREREREREEGVWEIKSDSRNNRPRMPGEDTHAQRQDVALLPQVY